jgi:hypothetical protein
MIQLLAFDIGIKNMAYCFSICNNNEFNVMNINKIDLNSKKNNIQNIIDNTIEFLDDIMNSLNIDINSKIIILIECQMTSIMRTIQTCINTYFKVISKHQNIDIDTIYVSAKHKLKIMDIYPDTIVNDKYKQNKLDSIFYTTHLLTSTFKDDKTLEIINSFKKKDDLCDAFLMCIYYYSNIYSKK